MGRFCLNIDVWKDKITNDEVYRRMRTIKTFLGILLDDGKVFLDMYYGNTNWKSRQ